MDVDLVVSRHRATIVALTVLGFIKSDTPVMESVAPDDVRGKHVMGNLPLHLAAEADTITTFRLPRPRLVDGKTTELTYAEVYEALKQPGAIASYKVIRKWIREKEIGYDEW